MHNPALTRSLRALSHPITLAAVGVLLLNDHVLRRWWPSWMTGKLGDVAWLAFFPLIMALAFALIVPARVKARDQVVAGLAFGFTALLFALGKTVPAVHALIVAVMGAILRMPPSLRLDPTDLLTLPALWIGWRVWHDQWHADRDARPRPVTRRAWVVLALGAVATLATSPPMPSQGISCLLRDSNGSITGTESGGGPAYVTKDGGLQWDETRDSNRGDDYTVSGCREHFHETWTVTDPENDQVQYLFVPEKNILRSENGGKDWAVAIDVGATQAQETYYSRTRSYHGGPADALFDEQTGNLIVAMREEGVLVRTPDGDWHWTAVGPYYRKEMTALFALDLIIIEVLLAVPLAAIAMALVLRIDSRRDRKLAVSRDISIFTWLIIAFLYQSMHLTLSGWEIFVYSVMFCIVAILASWTIVIAKSLSLTPSNTLHPWIPRITAGAVFLLYVLPFILWTQGIIPQYKTAWIVAGVLVIIAIVGGSIYYRRTPAET
jgi:hypothetical protein